MIRHAAVAALVLLVAPWSVVAQTPQFTINVATAVVRKAPSTGSPEIGQARRGTVLEVTRDIGAWLKVVWPDAEDGVGYVHQSMGLRSQRTTLEERVAAALPALAAANETPADVAAQTVPSGPAAVPMQTRTMYVPPPSHRLGVGARVGGPTGTTPDAFGITSRIWSRQRIGVQVEVFRSALTSDVAPGRLSSLEIAPSLIYSLRDRVGDYVWLRPYLGGGAILYRSTLETGTPEADPSTNTYGVRTFGGAELTFSSVPRFAISGDVGYGWAQDTFPGFEIGKWSVALAGHWYVR